MARTPPLPKTPNANAPGRGPHEDPPERRTSRRVFVGVLLVALVFALAAPFAEAQRDRTSYFIGLLRDSSSFRVRAQAALGLGRGESTPQVRAALINALSDSEPAVRVAAASAIERLADPQMLAGTRSAAGRERDSTVRTAERRAVRAMETAQRTASNNNSSSNGNSGSSGTNGTPRYYVGVGEPGSNVSGISAGDLSGYHRYLMRQVASMEGVVVAPEGESNSRARSQIRRRHLYGYYIDASIVAVEENAQGVSARVSVILATYPGRDMRAMLSGSARLPGGRGPRAVKQAIEGAFRGALRRIPAAMRSSEARASR